MAGTAKTNAFMLSTATVMMGAVDDVFDLNPTDHSLGLVKNFSITSEPSYVELTQGVKNTIVNSVMNQNNVRASMEVYEYTAKNLKYALGLDGSGTVKMTVTSTTASAVDGTSSPVSAIDVQTGDGSNFAAGDVIAIDVNGDDDQIVRKVTSVATDSLTLDHDLKVQIAANRPVSKVNMIDVGSKDEQPYLSAKAVGKLANGEPVVVLLPKLRIVNGFNMAFGTDDYGNMPFEFTIYDLVNSDTFYNWFGGASARIFRP